MFNQTLKFELHLIKLDCNDNWVSKTISDAKILWIKIFIQMDLLAVKLVDI